MVVNTVDSILIVFFGLPLEGEHFTLYLHIQTSLFNIMAFI